MRRLVLILCLITVLSSCSTRSDILSEEEINSLNEALLKLKEHEAIAMTIDYREDQTFAQNEEQLSETTKSHISYRLDEDITKIKYVNESSTTTNRDFIASGGSYFIMLNDNVVRKHFFDEGKEGELEKGSTIKDLKDYSIYFLEINTFDDYEKMSLRSKGNQKIYSYSGRSTNFIDINQAFIVEDNTEIVEYSLVVEDEKIKEISLITVTGSDSQKSTKNIKITITAINDDVDIQYLKKY